MARRHYDRAYRVGHDGPIFVRGDLLDYILQILHNIRLTNGGFVDYTPEAIYISVPPNGAAGTQTVYVQITGGKDMAGFYECSVFGNGIDEDATETEAAVRLLGFDIDISDVQGYYLATPIPGESSYEVAGQIPAPPVSGTWYLRSVDGIVRWVEAGVCNVSGSGA